MTHAEYARHRDYSRARVTQLVKAGRIIITQDGLIDSAKSDKFLDGRKKTKQTKFLAKAEAKKKGKVTGQKTIPLQGLQPKEKLTYDKARTALTAYKAQVAKIELEERQGSLISKDLVEKQAFDLGRKVRDAFLNIPGRISPIIAAETDQKKVHVMLLHEIEAVLEMLANKKGK